MKEETKEKLRKWSLEHNIKPPLRTGQIPWNKNKKTGLIPKTAFKKGQIPSIEVREKISKTMKTKGISPKIKWQKGMEPFKFLRENHWNWKGGISFEPYPLEWTDDLKDSIRKRDNYVCQLCGIHQDELDYKLHCHHIDYNKDNLDPKNLISLCRKCHMKTNINRNYWLTYFIK